MSSVIATSIAIAIGQEVFNFNLLVGASIIVASIVISSLSQVKKEKSLIETQSN